MANRIRMAGKNLSRREVLKGGSAAALSLLLPLSASGGVFEPSRAHSVILLWLDGGPSHLDTFDPKPDTDRVIRGPFHAINTNVAGIRFNAHLPRLARHAGKLAILRGVSHGEGGHERARHYLQTGHLPTASSTCPTYAEVLAPHGHTALQSGNFAADCIHARQLVENGTRFVTVTLAGWDTHENHFPRLQNHLLPTLDAGFSTLLQELSERGLLAATRIVCMGEFGRSPQINRNTRPGREHWPAAMSVVLAGGGIRGGQILGATDAQGREPLDRAISVEDLAAAIQHDAGSFAQQHPASLLRALF